MWNKIKCWLGWHDKDERVITKAYQGDDLKITECRNCSYRHEELLGTHSILADIMLTDLIKEFKKSMHINK